MEMIFKMSPEHVKQLAKEVAAEINKTENKREVIIPSSKDFQYTVSEIAEMSKQSKQTVARHCRDGLLMATKVGKSWKITQENYLTYIDHGNTEN